jgi:hypothetical protein
MCQSRNKCLSIQNKIRLWMKIMDKKGGGQPQPMDEDGEGPQWSQLMGSHECWGPMHALFKHIPLHEQVFMHNIVVLMEVE